MFRPALDLVQRSWGGVGSEVGGEWDALAKRVRRSKGTVLISHEILAGATREQVERAVGSLGSAEIHIVFTARDIARQVPAEWQERLKHRQVIPYRRFLRQIQAPGSSSPSARTFWQVQGLTGVLERWSRHLTPDRVHVVTVPQPGAPHGELWRRFCRAVEVDPAWAPEDSPRRNPSIGVAQSMMLRKLNRRLRAVGLAHSDYSSLVRRLVVHETLASHPDDERLALPPQFRDWAEEVSETWCEWLVGSGVDVVGDLDDLRPVWPDPDDREARPPPGPAAQHHRRRARRAGGGDRGGRPPRRPREPSGEAGEGHPAAARRPVSGTRARAPGGGCTTCATAAPRPGPTGSGTADPLRPGCLPGAQQLELLRRLNRAGPVSPVLADRVLGASAVGRGQPDLELVGAAADGGLRPAAGGPGRRVGRRAAAGGDGAAGRGRRRRGCAETTPAPAGATLAGALPAGRRPRARERGPGRDGRARSSPGRRGRRSWSSSGPTSDGCWPTPGRPAASTAACARGRHGYAGRRATTGCPPRTDLAQIADAWAHRVGPDRVHVVLDPRELPALLGVRRRVKLPAAPAAAVPDLGRRVAAAIGLYAPADQAAALLRHRLRPMLSDAGGPSLGVPEPSARVGDRAGRAHGRGDPRRWIRCARTGRGPAADHA